MVDESGFAFDTGDPKIVESAFVRLLDLLAAVRDTPGQARRTDLLFDIESADGTTLIGWLSNPRIDRDTRNELWRRLDKLPVHDVEPQCLDVNVSSRPVTMAAGISISLAESRAGRQIACLTTETAQRRGPCHVAADATVAASIHFLVDDSDCPAFWRDVLLHEPHTADQLEQHSEQPFPNCVFAEGVWGQLNRFDGGHTEIWPRLLANLTGLDDHAVRVWAAHVEPRQRIEQMRITAGVDCSPESPRTHANPAAMRQRTVLFDGEPIVCEWHAKLERNRNRIHFAVRDGRVYIGRFVDHLTT
ncbi:hypothetical protein [Nocardia inohanensis]|uniref:hypothetical protein n=1 Tax=Nocardia inohanensis TaxID=209246 RepID=UPI00082BB846|nr:hypothetical protein [Nocardia inohanensis]